MTAQARFSPIASVASPKQNDFTQRVPSPNQAPLSLGHGRVWTSFEKMGAPVNRFINKVGSEAFWPTGLEEESEKAARILSTFCKEGINPENTIKTEKAAKSKDTKPEFNPDSKHELSLKTDVHETTPLVPTTSYQTTNPSLPPRGPRNSPKTLLKIPPSVIHNALGLAIFTVFRAGTWGASLAAGSGILVARDANTQKWSSPSAIGVSTLGVGFVTGVDVVDCVVVINTVEALDRFKSMRVSLGGDVGLTVGPWGAGGAADYGVGKVSPTAKELEAGVKEKGKWVGKPVYTYIKSRGLWAGLQLDGTVIGVRSDENARFYGERVDVDDILGGRARRWTALAEVLEEIEEGARGVRVGLERQIREAPVLLDFVPPKDKRRASDVARSDAGQESGREVKGEKETLEEIRRAEEKALEKRAEEKKNADDKAWGKGDSFA